MIKVVIFDGDGILVHRERRFSETLAAKHDISPELTLPFFTGPFRECLVGRADLKEVILPYLNKWGWDKGLEALLDYWFSLETKTDKELIKYIQELRKQGVLCFLATNNEKHRFEYMMNKMGLGKMFDKAYSSAYLGYKKPDQEFFLKIYNELKNIKKSEVLFIDDTLENVKGGEKFGFNADLFTSLDNLRDKIAFLNKN